VLGDQRVRHDAEVVFFSEASEKLDVAGSPPAEVEVLAHHDGPHS
jgi:hypothetical protein